MLQWSVVSFTFKSLF